MLFVPIRYCFAMASDRITQQSPMVEPSQRVALRSSSVSSLRSLAILTRTETSCSEAIL